MSSVAGLRDRLLVPAYATVLTFLIGLALLVPGRTFATVYGHDLFVHLDGAWRVVSGQLPNRDFHTPLGLIAYVLPGVALAMTGSLGLTMPLAMLLYALLLLVPIIWLCQSRMPLWLGLLFSTFLIVLMTAPLNVGETPKELSFAMYYNRWSWVALSLVFVTLAPHRLSSRWNNAADLAVIGMLLTLLFYLKATFLVFAAIYVCAMVVVRRTRSMAIGGLLVGIALVAIASLVLRTTPAYIDDIRNAARVSGVVRHGFAFLIEEGAQNGRQIVVLGAVAAMGRLRGTGWTERLAAVFIVGASLILANQNAQGFELPALVAAAAVLFLAPTRVAKPVERTGALVVALAIGALAYNPLALGLRALVLHAKQARNSTSPLDNVVLAYPLTAPQDVPVAALLHSAYATRPTPAELPPLRMQLTTAEYGMTLQDGVDLLRSSPALRGSVATFDLANPFNALLRRAPARHDNSWNHFGRTFSPEVHLSDYDALGNVDVIMEPKDSTGYRGTAVLMQIFAPYMRQHFRLAGESSFWRAYARVDARS